MADNPTQLLKGFCESRIAFLGIGAGFNRTAREHPDPPRRSLLRTRRHWQRRRRTAEQRDELAALHSITSSARPISGSGMVRPRALALFRLMINSTLVACWTGRSAGFSP